MVYRDTWVGPYSSPGDTEYEINSTAEKAILLIRNPYDAIYGYRHYIFTGLKGRADNSKFKGNGMFTRTGILPPSFLKCAMNINGMIIYCCFKDWNRFVHSAIQLWEDLYLKLMVKKRHILIIHYEDLKDTNLRRSALEDVGRFLNRKIDDKRLECVMKQSFTRFQRKKKKFVDNKSHINNAGIDCSFHNDSNSRDVFETKHKIWINSAIKKVQNTLLKYLRSSRIKSTRHLFTNCSIEYRCMI